MESRKVSGDPGNVFNLDEYLTPRLGGRTWICAVAIALFLIGSPGRAAKLYGDAISCSASSPFTCAPATATAGPGVEFEFLLSGRRPAFTEDFAPNEVILTSLGSIGFHSGLPSTNLTDVDLSNSFTPESVISNAATNFSALNVSLAADTLTINFNGASFAAGQTIVIG